MDATGFAIQVGGKKNENLILRVDKDFNSKTNLLNRRVFLIDADIYRQFTNASRRRDDQALNDVLINYVLTLKKGD